MVQKILILFACCLAGSSCARLKNNDISSVPRIKSSDELISAIIKDCFQENTMSCLQGKVLTYLDTILGQKEVESRAYYDLNSDQVIYDRVAKILKTNEIRIQLPETIFDGAVLTYRSDRGLDLDISQNEARGDMMKKKLLLPILLLLKLKLKAIIPILLMIVKFKAMKALILSKIAIKLVLGFLIYQLIQKLGMKMPMTMNPMMPATPSAEYGTPLSTPASPPSSSYEASAWEANSNPYSRVWEPSSASSSHNLAYSAYYPSGSNTYSLAAGSNNPYSSYSTSGSSSSPTLSSPSSTSSSNP